MKIRSTIPTYFFDASALVKLVVQEPGSRTASQLKHDAGRVYTSWILTGEALGVLKRLWSKKKMDDHDYRKSVYILLSHLKLGAIEPVDVVVEQGQARLITHEAAFIDKKDIHSTLDAADMFQLEVIRNSWLQHFAGGSKTTLVTADKKLGKAAKSQDIPIILLGESDP